MVAVGSDSGPFTDSSTCTTSAVRGTWPGELDQPAQAHRGRLYGVAPAPDGSVWGSSLGFPGSVVRLVPDPNPPATALGEISEVLWNKAQGAGPGLLAARIRRRSERRRLDRARQRAPRVVRPAQVHRPAQRTLGHGAALPRGVDALSRGAAAAQGSERSGKRRWAHRRSKGRLERERPLGHHQHASALSHGDRQGDDEQGDALPAAARSAGRSTASCRSSRSSACCTRCRLWPDSRTE